MSAIARYFHARGFNVCGYDLTPSPITDQLIKEGIEVHFSDDLNMIPKAFFSHRFVDRLHPCCAGRPLGIDLLQIQWLSRGEASRNSRRDNSYRTCTLCRRNTWQDYDLYFAGTFAQTESCGLQCVSGRDFQQLSVESVALGQK